MYVVTKLKSQVTTNNKTLKICLGIKGELFTYWFSNFFLVDICMNYQNLADGTRKYDHITVNSKCDNTLTYGWYRFQGAAGTKMVTACPPVNRCDTTFPVWLNGDHPTMVESKVTRQICSYRFGDCCDSSYTILVKRCSSYYIYRLFFLGVCNTRYCSTD